MSNTHKEWLEKVTGGASLRAVDRKTGLNYSALGRSLRGDGLSTDQVVRIAHAYGADITEALQDTGILPSDEEAVRRPREIAAAIKRLADQLADQASHTPDNVEHLFDQNPAKSDPSDYDLPAVAYSDDEDTRRGWEADD